MRPSFFALAPILVLTAVLMGCATPPPPTLYSWDSFEPTVYSYLKGEPVEPQIALLEKQRAAASAAGKKLPPGFSAHLAMLYGKVGRDADAAQMMAEEKQRYPESALFLDNVVNGFKKTK